MIIVMVVMEANDAAGVIVVMVTVAVMVLAFRSVKIRRHRSNIRSHIRVGAAATAAAAETASSFSGGGEVSTVLLLK